MLSDISTMANLTDTGEFAIPLVRRRSSHPAPREARRLNWRSPIRAAAMVGAPAGVLALALVQAMAPDGLTAAVGRVATVRGVPFAVALGLAYFTAGAAGAVAGGLFGNVTRNLRRWVPLAAWALVFFTSVALVFVGASSSFRHGMHPDLAGPIVAAGALYGLLVSVSLPIRRAR